MSLERFASVEELLRQKTTAAPVFCFYPSRFRAAAQEFVTHFPGDVLYAVKANPHPDVMRWLVEGGIHQFDTASIAEMECARRALPRAHCSYNHPVKPRSAIIESYQHHGIRDFVVDHPAELDKLLAAIPRDIVVQVRIAMPNPQATISFNSKFGASPEQAIPLLRAVEASGATPAVSTHLGYQTTDPEAFARGLRTIAEVVTAAAVQPAYINLGGGFPSLLLPAGVTLRDYFNTIARTRGSLPVIADVPLRCEPGSALTHCGGSVFTQVDLVKEEAIYINDGLYGALAEIIHSKTQPPTRVLTPEGSIRSGTLRSYTVFGPTCDSYDVLPVRFMLPGTLREGDWLDLGMMGAYSNVLITDFNGVGAHDYALIGD